MRAFENEEDRLMLTAAVVQGARFGPPLAVTAERERIARELNRYAIHGLFGIGLKLQAIAASGSDSAISDRIDDCVNELDLAITDLRALIFKLEPGNV
jgi:signal transduction histidine kinase